jgi:transposase
LSAIEEAGKGVRGAMDWAQVRALAADGVSQREIARRLGIGRNTVRRMVEACEPPRYSRASAGSMLDPLEPVMRRLLAEWPDIRAPRVTEILREDHGYAGSVDLVRKRLATLRPRPVRPAQRTGYRPGQVLQLDWAETPTRPADRRPRATRLRAGRHVALSAGPASRRA